MKSWQHGVVVQSLYSGRCTSESAPYFDYGLAQARSDIFFSLLFGGTINCSAGAFFDSPIALRAFGELMSHPDFEAVRLKRGWTPLRLQADNPAALDGIRPYVAGRWRNPAMKFALFRELDEDFHPDSALSTAALRMQAAYAIDGERFSTHPGLLPDALTPFLTSVRVARDPGNGPSRDEQGKILTGTALDAEYAPILNNPHSSAAGIEAILRYIDESGCFHSMAAETHQAVLGDFSPKDAVRRRTADIVERQRVGAGDLAAGLFELDDLIESNKRLESLAGHHGHMNAVHVHGRTVYRHMFPLIRQWLEADWHGIRHRAYASAACLYSTNWEVRQVFDFDARARAFYLEPGHIDDTLQVAQERFGELDWGILLAVISDVEWPRRVLEVRSASTEKAASAASEALLNLLARRIVQFNFQVASDRLSISSKVAAAGAVCASVASVCLGHFQSSLVPLAGAGFFSAAAGAFDAAAKGANTTIAMLPGVRQASERYVGKNLRTAISPGSYLGSAEGARPAQGA